MPRAAHITVRKDPRSPALPWEVNIPASLAQSGGRERPHFATRGEAERRRSEEEKRLADYRLRALGLTHAQQIEAAECYAIIEPHGRSLRDAVRLAVATWEAEERTVPIETLFSDVLKAKAQDKLAPDTLRGIRTMGRFAAAHPGQMVSAFTTAQVDGWLRGLKKKDGKPLSGTSRNTYRRALSQVFSHAIAQGWRRDNPVQLVARAAEEDEEPVFLTPVEVETILRAASPHSIANIALCAFGAMRPGEAAKLSWSDIGHDQIRVRATIAKTRRNRIIPVLPTLREWLALAERRPDGLIGYKRKECRKAWQAAGYPNILQDALRHSYGTYRGHFINEDDLAREMGNSPQVIIQHYRGVSDKASAEKYFAILPNEKDHEKHRQYVAGRATHHRRVRRGRAARPLHHSPVGETGHDHRQESKGADSDSAL